MKTLLTLILTLLPSAVLADFKVCNKTNARIGLSVGYKDGEIWVTEGWWNLRANTCETVLRGTLVARYYYVFGLDYDKGGEWGGRAYMCSRDKEYVIKGIDDCLTRGYDRVGFMEIDTQEQKEWTVNLDDTSSRPQSMLPKGK